MTDRPDRADWTAPFGTSARIRNRAIWAVAFFAASVPPAFIGMGLPDAHGAGVDSALPIALAFWTIGALIAVAAAFPTLRYWDALPAQTRLLGALPMVTVSFFLTVVLIGALLA
jgi:hypothetical protein